MPPLVVPAGRMTPAALVEALTVSGAVKVVAVGRLVGVVKTVPAPRVEPEARMLLPVPLIVYGLVSVCAAGIGVPAGMAFPAAITLPVLSIDPAANDPPALMVVWPFNVKGPPNTVEYGTMTGGGLQYTGRQYDADEHPYALTGCAP